MDIEAVKVHRLKNQLAIILGFAELLLEEMPADDPHRTDLEHILRAAKSALGELPPLPAQEFAKPVEHPEDPNGDQ
jgi:hypothetical protein